MLKTHRYSWLLLILLGAAFLRLHDLPDVPPGMTHDEADHGLAAWGVVEGDRPLYFTVGYGREPLYDYSTALLMSFLGPTYLAGRLTAVYFSLLLIAATFAWVRRAFDRETALLTAAGLAVSFWPLMVSRHALRTITMPAIFTLAVYFFWRGMMQSKEGRASDRTYRRSIFYFVAAGIILGTTFYTYMPARIMWFLFPALLAYLLLLRAPAPWRGTLLMLALATLVAAPLLLYLRSNPQAEVRLDQLAGPLRAASELNLEPLFDNARESLLLFTFAGDTLWRYNVAGRPILPWSTGLLFYAGVAYSLYYVVRAVLAGKDDGYPRAPAFFLALAWLLGGFAPALITGPEQSVPRTAAMLPVLYLFPAVTLSALRNKFMQHTARPRWLGPLAALLFFALLGVYSYRTYFHEWAGAREVQIQYEQNLVAAVDWLDQLDPATAAISTNQPNRFHDPATARMYLDPGTTAPRWFDGRSSLLLPAENESVVLITAEAPLHPMLSSYLVAKPLPAPAPGLSGNLIDTLSTFNTLYPQFQHEINILSTALSTDLVLGEAVAFLGYRMEPDRARPGDTVRVATLWRVESAPDINLVFFTHLLGEGGQPVAQVDRLDVPSAYWVAGDRFIQLHELILPADLAAGTYPVQVGAYDAADWRRRLPLLMGGAPAGEAISLPPLAITP